MGNDDAASKCDTVWSFPPEQDGWYHSHNALRLDMDDFTRVIKALDERVSAGSDIADWEAANVSRWWKRWMHTVHHHHNCEEEFWFPQLTSRCEQLPPSMTKDHIELMSRLRECDSVVNELMSSTSHESRHTSQAAPMLKGLKGLWTTFQSEMCDHLAEEERVCIGLLRKHFTQEEGQDLGQKFSRKYYTMEDMAQFLRPMSEQQRAEFFKQEAIPGFVQRFLMLPALRKYNKQYTSALEEVFTGQRSEDKSMGCMVQ